MSSRRRLLLAALGLAGAGGVGAWAFGRPLLEGQIASTLRRKLSYLKLDDAGVRAFARDQAARITAKRMSLNRVRYHLTSGANDTFKRYWSSQDGRSRIARAEDALVSTYLVSSDFFFHGADEARTVMYLGYYDAIARPCSSPFARPMTDAPAVG